MRSFENAMQPGTYIASSVSRWVLMVTGMAAGCEMCANGLSIVYTHYLNRQHTLLSYMAEVCVYIVFCHV